MFDVECPMRWSDMDAQGHVNNAVVVEYLQDARVALFQSGPASALLDHGVLVVSHQVEYLGSITYSADPLLIRMFVPALGGARIEIGYEVLQQGKTVAKARTVLCPYDFAEGRPKRLQQPVRAHLGQYRRPVEAFRELATPELDGRGTITDVYSRWSDNDGYGHINNAVAFDYIQQARIEATQTWDPAMMRAGKGLGAQYNWLVARQDVDYVRQMSHRLPPYAARTAPTRLGSTSITLACEIFDPDTGDVFTRGRTVLVCADTNMRPTTLPESTRAGLGERLVEQ